MENLEKILKAVANKRRLAILKYLKRGRASVGEIAKAIELSFRASSRHLRKMYSAQILKRNQVGLIVFYEIKNEQNPVADYLIQKL